MKKFTEASIRKECPHCDPKSFALRHLLKETENFWVVCDVHPLAEGHILIIPKHHLSCVGEYGKELFQEFIKLYKEFSIFVEETYGSVNSFEHGKIGQTVFHSHVHLLPFSGKAIGIVPEGIDKLRKINSISKLIEIFNNDGQYLFFSTKEGKWIVDSSIGAPRFFRDRYAKCLEKQERGSWKEMHSNKQIMKKAENEIYNLENHWKNYNSK